jgi:hypothetical protein
MRQIITIIIGFQAFIQAVSSQPEYKGIVLKNKLGYTQGDTLTIAGIWNGGEESDKKYLVKKGDKVLSFRQSWVKILDTIPDFWESAWFNSRSGYILKKGWDSNIRYELNRECKNYIIDLKSDNMLIEDSVMNNYLNDLLKSICSTPLHKGFKTGLKIYVVKSIEPDIYSFDNGTIFITSSLLAQYKTEAELTSLFSKETAKIVNDYQVINIKKQRRNQTAAFIIGSLTAITAAVVTANSESSGGGRSGRGHNQNSNFSFWGSVNLSSETAHTFSRLMKPAPIFISEAQDKLSGRIGNAYMANGYVQDDYAVSPATLTNIIAPAIEDYAWQLYFDEDYKKALMYVDRLEAADAAINDDLILKAKLYRKLYTSDESRYEALRYLKKVEETSNPVNVDVFKEEGILYNELGQKYKAKDSFTQYQEGLQQLQSRGFDYNSELNWVKIQLQSL